jgi:hypothetical protein
VRSTSHCPFRIGHFLRGNVRPKSVRTVPDHIHSMHVTRMHAFLPHGDEVSIAISELPDPARTDRFVQLRPSRDRLAPRPNRTAHLIGAPHPDNPIHLPAHPPPPVLHGGRDPADRHEDGDVDSPGTSTLNEGTNPSSPALVRYSAEIVSGGNDSHQQPNGLSSSFCQYPFKNEDMSLEAPDD